MKLYGSHTKKNLEKAMAREAHAYITYTILAGLLKGKSKALEEQVSLLAHNEKEHYKVWMKLLFGDEYYDDEAAVLDAIVGEVSECEEIYPEMARVAREEGFNEIAEKFDLISQIECNHAWQFEDILKVIRRIDDDNEISKKGFVCLNCGYIHDWEKAPATCPVCDHPKEFFKKIE